MQKCELEKYVEYIIKAYKEHSADKDMFLSFTLYDSLYEKREEPLFDNEYLHARLEVPMKELAEQVEKLFDIDFYELSLHMNTMTPMHTAFCSLVENSELVYYFIDQGKGTVKLEDNEVELEAILQKEGIIPVVDGMITVGDAFGPWGVIGMKDSKGDFIPMRYRDIPAKDFFDWVDKTEGIDMLSNDSDDFYYEIGDDPKEKLRKYTTELLLSILENENTEST